MTRFVPLALLAACASSPGGGSEATLPPTRIVMKQYYRNGSTFVVENLSGRDLVEMRSQPVEKGDVPTAWISDADMRRTLRALQKYEFEDFARPRPVDPKGLGARGELTVYHPGGRTRSLIRRRGQTVEEAEAYQDCVAVFQQVWRANRPQYQAVTGKGDFGVKRADYKRGQ